MSFASSVDRVRCDFTDMPVMELTIAQAVRLWKLGADDCRQVLDALVDVGFLRWTPRRTVIRAGVELSGSDVSPSHISVRTDEHGNKSV
ncbi:MAG: hypothetical protein ABL993_13350 [Vicinamibacterales bacterium]